MADPLSTSISGLVAFQRAIATTSHNISNVNTPGYSRQSVEFATQNAQVSSAGNIGSGVTVVTVERDYDDFLTGQLRNTTSNFQQLDAYYGLATKIDNILADSETGLAPSLQNFYDAVQVVSENPSSVPERQLLISEAEALVNRFEYIDGRLGDLNTEVNQRLRDGVVEVNQIAEEIAALNTEIGRIEGLSQGQPANDLLDQRDELVRQLSELTSVSTLIQEDGSMNVFIGNGQPLVVGSRPTTLYAVNNPFDSSRVEIAYGSPTGDLITGALQGGEIGGLSQFRDDTLIPAQNQLGQLALGFAESFNAQHRMGMDLGGQLGQDFFSVSQPKILPGTSNTGTATISATVTSAAGLTTSDYQLSYDGSQWQLLRLDDGATFTGAGPFNVDGLSVAISGSPNAGDRYEIRPTRGAASLVDVAIANPQDVAAASPVRSNAEVNNLGTATIATPSVLDINDPNLLQNVDIEFTSATTYSVNGSGSFAYTSGADIDINGWRVQIEGTPSTGDRFSISSNAGAVGDNSNALALADLRDSGVFNGGNTTSLENYAGLVGSVATATREAEIGRDAQRVLNDQAILARDSFSGVNLDEEAANLLRFQQAYQAAAQAISIADNLFQFLINSVR